MIQLKFKEILLKDTKKDPKKGQNQKKMGLLVLVFGAKKDLLLTY